MVWFIVAQVNLIAQNSYPGATWVGLSSDFSGDGVLDAYAFYGNDSVVIYDGVSSNPIAGYRAPSGYSMVIYRLAYRTVLLYMYDYTDKVLQFQIYEDLNNLVYTSPTFNYSSTGFVYPTNYDADQLVDILVRVDSALYVYETSYSIDSKEKLPGDDRAIGRVDIISDRGQVFIPVRLTGNASMRIFDTAGKLILSREISRNHARIDLPAGVYVYELSSDEFRISGKLVVR